MQSRLFREPPLSELNNTRNAVVQGDRWVVRRFHDIGAAPASETHATGHSSSRGRWAGPTWLELFVLVLRLHFVKVAARCQYGR